AAFTLAGCIKQPIRSTRAGPESPVGNETRLPEVSSTTNDPSELPHRLETAEPSRYDRAALQGQAIFFEYDRSEIPASERAKLRAAKEYLDTHPGRKLLLEGYCDWRGTAEYNLSLGDRRASSAKQFLQSIGVTPDKLDTLSKGSMEAAKNGDTGAMKKDRRVELVVVN